MSTEETPEACSCCEAAGDLNVACVQHERRIAYLEAGMAKLISVHERKMNEELLRINQMPAEDKLRERLIGKRKVRQAITEHLQKIIDGTLFLGEPHLPVTHNPAIGHQPCGLTYDGSQPCGLTHDQLVQACKNVGLDLTCGGCAGVFFTGGRWNDCDASCTTTPDRRGSSVVFSP